jgi:hypothetical protein
MSGRTGSYLVQARERTITSFLNVPIDELQKSLMVGSANIPIAISGKISRHRLSL